MVAMALDADGVQRNFQWMASCFAVCHSAMVVVVTYATSVLPGATGYFGNGILYATTVLASLLAAPAIAFLGRRAALLVSAGLLSTYVGALSLAMLLVQQPGEASVDSLVYVGSLLGGLGAGLIWTTQGAYFGRAAALLAEGGSRSRKECTTDLSGQFAWRYLCGEVAMKLLFSGLLALGHGEAFIAALCCGMSVLATVLMARLESLPPSREDACGSGETPTVSSSITRVVSFWGDARIWLLSPTNIAFGFGSAFLNGYFNAERAAPELSRASLGVLSAATAFFAAVGSQLYSRLGNSFGKGVPLSLGSLAFVLVPVIAMFSSCCQGWGLWTVSVYLIFGLGRASYESTNRAVLSDMYQGRATEGAFANFSFQTAIAGSVVYFAGASGTRSAYVTLVAGALVLPLYLVAVRCLHPQDGDSDSERGPLLEMGSGEHAD